MIRAVTLVWLFAGIRGDEIRRLRVGCVRWQPDNKSSVCFLDVPVALGIGANTAIFTVINGVLIRPVPGGANPAELVIFERLQKNNPDYSFGYPDYLDYRDYNQSFTGLAARCRTALGLSHGTTERIAGELVSGNYFSVLGVNPASGRLQPGVSGFDH